MSGTTQLLFDCESLGISSDAVVLDCSCIVYDLIRDKDKSLVELMETQGKTFKLSVVEQKKMGRKIDQSTVEWWSTQGPEALKKIAPRDDDLHPNDFFLELSAWLQSQGYTRRAWAWQRGNVDIAWLDSMFDMMSVERNRRPIDWAKVREIRTAVDLAGVSSKLNGYADGIFEDIHSHIPMFTKHDSLHDVAMEVLNLRLAGVFGGWNVEDDDTPF